MTPIDPYTGWDAAYVLGALAAQDRTDYETHLARCRSCRDAVADLAGLPGLLAHVPFEEVLALDAPDGGWPEPPADLMPVLTDPAPSQPPTPPTRVPRTPRRWLVAAAAAVALMVGGIGGYLVAQDSASAPSAPTVSATGPVRLAFSDVVPSTMTAVVDVSTTAAGTRLRVECQYADEQDQRAYPEGTGTTHASEGPDYSLWVVDRSGVSSRLDRWTARPGQLMEPMATTELAVSQIRSIEIRLVDKGTTILRATVPDGARVSAADAATRRGAATANA